MDWKDGLILFGAGLGILAWDTSRSYKNLAVDISAYGITDVDFGNNSATLQIDMQITNPLLLGVTLYSLVGDVYLDGNYVASVNQLFDYYIRGKKTHIIPIVLHCNLFNVSTTLIRKLLNDSDSIALRVVGNLKVAPTGVVNIPLDIEKEITW